MRPGDFAWRKTIYFGSLHQKVAAPRLAAAGASGGQS